MKPDHIESIRCPFERGLAAYRKGEPSAPTPPTKARPVNSDALRGVMKAAHILRSPHGGQYSKAKK